MPITNLDRKESFGRIDKNQNAISDRGWYPLNKVLLSDLDILATISDDHLTCGIPSEKCFGLLE